MIAALFALVFAQAPGVTGPVGDRIDSIVEAAERAGFHGSVMVAQRGQTILNKGYGFANVAAGTRYSPTTLVQIGSNVKDMTRVAVYQLLERGRLSVNDSIGKFFRGVPADRRGITVQMLLHHRAGLPLGAGGGDTEALTRDRLLRALNTIPLESPPGTRERYSNMGYAVLAAIVEQLSGQPFDRYVADNILRPAGMRETGSHLMHFDPARIAHGYQGDRDIGTVLDMPHDSTGHLYQLRGNGGYLSTPADMIAFYRAVRGTTLLRDREHREAVLPNEPGVMAGSDLVSMFLFGWYPGAGVEIVIASNHSAAQGNRLLRQILPALGIMDGEPGPGGPQIVTNGGGGEGEPQGVLLRALPADSGGQTIRAYLVAYNSGDTTVMRRFFEQNVLPNPQSPPMEQRLSRFRDMFANLGTLAIREVRRTPEGDGLVIVCNSSTGETVSVTFIIEAQAPWRLRGMRVAVG